MKKYLCIYVFLLFSITSLFAQDKSDVAIALYQKADDAYNIADYETALASLKQAEQTLGSTNTKILYLKIKTLDMLAKVDGKSGADLQLSLATFFKLADKNTYPQNKYSEILLIDVNLKQRIKDEEEAYNKVKNSTSVGSFDNFFTQYPNSKYKSALDGKYKELQARQKADLATKFEEQWRGENMPIMKKNRAKGIGLLTSGLVGIVGGGAMMGLGYSPQTVSELYNGDKIEPRTVSFKDIMDDESGRSILPSKVFEKQISLAITGTALTVFGIIAAPISAKFFKANKKIKQDAKNNNIELSLIQRGNAVGFAMKF